MHYATDVTMVRCLTCGDWVRVEDAVRSQDGYDCSQCENPERFVRRAQWVEEMRRAMGRAA